MFCVFVMVRNLFKNAIKILTSGIAQTLNLSKTATGNLERSFPVHIYLF